MEESIDGYELQEGRGGLQVWQAGYGKGAKMKRGEKRDPTKFHADLECPVCEGMCTPYKDAKDGGAYYRCRRENQHPDFRPVHFKIDGDGELHT